MSICTPLSMPEAQAFWLRRLPELYGETVNYLRKAPLTRPGGGPRSQRGCQPDDATHAQRELNFSLARAALVADEALHEDIVQELGIRFFRNVERGRIWAGTHAVTDRRTKKEKSVAYVDCWLSKVHRRVAREYARAEARQYLHRCAVPTDDDGGKGSPPVASAIAGSQVPSPEDVASAREMLSALETSLMSYSERESDIFLLYVSGYSHKEIATALRITEGTARTSVHRTRTRLLQEAEETGTKHGGHLTQERRVA